MSVHRADEWQRLEARAATAEHDAEVAADREAVATRERDEARTEVERLTGERDAAKAALTEALCREQSLGRCLRARRIVAAGVSNPEVERVTNAFVEEE